MVTRQDLEERAAEVMAEVLVPSPTGTSYGDDPIMSKFGEVVRVTNMGVIWGRPGLDCRTRTLVCVVSDIATGRFSMLPVHVRMAMRQGWTSDELVEIALQLIDYVGAPLAHEALLTLRDVLNEDRTVDR